MGSCLRKDTLFYTKIPKNIPWLAARPHYALIRECPPPRALMPIGTMINLTVVSIPFAVNVSLNHLFPKRHKLDLSVR